MPVKDEEYGARMDLGLMKKKAHFLMLVAIFLPAVLMTVIMLVFGHKKAQHDQMQNVTNTPAATNVVAEADTNVRVFKFTVRMHLTNEVPARPTNGTSGR